nr:MAG TPA: hypothetical protein [Caudoviricetes sp.]
MAKDKQTYPDNRHNRYGYGKAMNIMPPISIAKEM